MNSKKLRNIKNALKKHWIVYNIYYISVFEFQSLLIFQVKGMAFQEWQ